MTGASQALVRARSKVSKADADYYQNEMKREAQQSRRQVPVVRWMYSHRNRA